ncbi:metal ABC transporter ATP-binding protein [Kiloniella sp. b19]|uniref:metal ABC transporter ATP-binding protein n=1 Tax=Kiloniella sp. GXU_MW_B19 TaxID=3141326 RepID=UPI0031D18284
MSRFSDRLRNLPAFFKDCALAVSTGEKASRSTASPFAIQGMNVAYHNKAVVRDLNLELQPQRLTAVIGPNGAGKSTFIKAALGLVPKLGGRVSVFGKALDRQRHLIAYVPQRGSVDWDFPASALDVVAMGLYGRIGWIKPVRKHHLDTARHWLEEVGMAEFADRQIGQLSGGQQQRVFLARALAQNAELYIMDEPFAGVDAATERAIITTLKKLKAQGKTVLCVHHDLQTAPDYFDNAFIMRVTDIASGPIKEVFTMENLQKAYGGRLPEAELQAILSRQSGRDGIALQ